MGLSSNKLQFFTNWCLIFYTCLVIMDITGKKIQKKLWESVRALTISVCFNGLLILSLNGKAIGNKYNRTINELNLINFISHIAPLLFIFFYKPKNLIGESNKKESFYFALFVYFIYCLFFNTNDIYVLNSREIFLFFSFTVSVFIAVINLNI